MKRTRAEGGWIVTSAVQGDDGVRWVSLTFFPEVEPDDEQPSGSWPRESGTRRLTRSGRIKRAG